MLSREEYLCAVVRQVRFWPDRTEIRQELEDHIDDLLEDADAPPADEGTYIAAHMGEAETVGRALNAVHNPWLGWLWYASRLVLVVLVLAAVPFLILGALIAILTAGRIVIGYSCKDAGVAAVVRPAVRGQIDDVHFAIDEIIKTRDGEIHVHSRTWYTPFSRSEQWTFDIGNFLFDEDGNHLYGGGYILGGFVNYCCDQLEELPPDAEKVFVNYDSYGRRFWAEIPLDWQEVEP